MNLRCATQLASTLVLTSMIIAACGGESDDADGGAATAVRSPTATARGSVEETPSANASAAVTSSPTISTASQATSTPRAPVADGESITISAVGDVSLGREVVDRMTANGADYPYALIAHLIDGDIGFANLEGALTERGEAWPKGYNFRTPPRFASGLRDAGFDIVSLANNHTMDYGEVGLTDTLDALDAVDIAHPGAGVSGIEAAAPVYVEANGLRVAFIACAATPAEAGGFRIEQWEAIGDGTGLAVCHDEALRTWIGIARQEADFVIVTAHAGTEYRNAPDATQARIVNTALAAGADAFIGHHAHVVQPIELRDGQLIAWGLGNFIFDLDNVDLANIPQPRVSLVLRITLTKGAGVTSWGALPVVQDANEDRPRPATAEESAVLQSLLLP